MGFGIKELAIILIIILLIFGTKKLRGVGGDVGGWIRDFRKALREEPVGDEVDAAPEIGPFAVAEPQPKKEQV